MAKNGAQQAYTGFSVRSNTPASKKQPTKRQLLAANLCDIYNARLRIAVSRFSSTTLFLRPFATLTKPQRRQWLAAATTCMDTGADPKSFVVAQFECFLEYVRANKRQRFLPQPCHFSGPGAQARFLENEMRKRDTQITTAKPTQQKQYYREERKLRGLVRIYRQPESEVLLSYPTEFTQTFLEHRGVWPLVADQYTSALDS